jgi:hypothetical protein
MPGGEGVQPGLNRLARAGLPVIPGRETTDFRTVTLRVRPAAEAHRRWLVSRPHLKDGVPLTGIRVCRGPQAPAAP